jgi:hypothetical protein
MERKPIQSYVETINPFAPEFSHLTNEEMLELQKKMGLPRSVTEVCDGIRHFKVNNATGRDLASRACDCRR